MTLTSKMTVGLDLARRTMHRAVIVGADGQRIGKPRAVPTSPDALDALIAAAGGPCTVVLEPTGTVWLAVSAWLIHRGCVVHRVDTRGAHEFRKFTSRNAKSDSADAEALARMPAANPAAMRPLVLPDAARHGLDRLTRLRAQLVDDRTRRVNRVLATVETYSPPLVPVLGKGLTDEKRYVLRHFLDPRNAAAAGRDGIMAAAREAGVEVSGTLAEAWVEAATTMQDLVAPLGEDLPWSYEIAQVEVDIHLDLIEQLDARVAELEARIAEAYHHVDRSAVLTNLPGIGNTIAPLLMAVIGDITRFRSAKAFVSYVGLAPRKNQTGLADRSGQPISKSGNRRARHYLFLAAEVARRCDPDLGALYARQTARGAHHNKAVIAVAAALARRVYAVLLRASDTDAAERTYNFRDVDGSELTRQDAARITRERYPSKAAQRAAKDGARAPAARKEGQPSGSPTGVTSTRLRDSDNAISPAGS